MYKNFIADLGNNFLPGDVGARQRAKSRFDNVKKSSINQAPFAKQYHAMEEKATVLALEKVTWVQDHLVS